MSMTSFALGLTKTVVEGTLSLVKSTVEEEKKLRETVRHDLVFISDEFEVMQSFLRVANNNINNNDQVALTMVRQLRNLAFDVEDYVEYVVHLDLDDKCSRWAWLWRLWYTVKCCGPPLPLDVAVADIKQLKTRVEDISQRNIRYNSLILHGSNNNKQQQPAVTVVMPPPAEQPLDATTVFDILRDAWEATRMWHSDSKRYSLQELVVPKNDGDGNDLQVISVWGSSGHPGTASIIRRVYHDPRTCEKFKIRAWMKLTHPFNHDEFVKSLLAQFSMSSSHQAEVMEEDHLIMEAKLMQQIKEQSYLVVLEDVFTLEEWALIRMYLPDHKNGGRIVLSTPELRIAHACTGAPFEVLELRQFPGDNQFLCAFFKTKMPRNVGEFYRQLQHHGLISVWGPDSDDKTNLIDILYKGLICGWFKEFEQFSNDDKASKLHMLLAGISNRKAKLHGFAFEHYSWVDVPDPFYLKVFAQRLFLNFYSNNNIYTIENPELGEATLIKWCREFLFERKNSLVVINGLRSTDDWESIKSTFLSSSTAPTNACCILVITTEETMAMHCVKDHKYQAFEVKDLMADTSIATMLSKGSWYYEIRGLKRRLLYDRSKDKPEWIEKFGDVNCNVGNGEEEFRVFWVDIESRAALTHAYYCAFPQIQRRSWVDLPESYFNLTEFSWRLLLDFYSDDIVAKEDKAVGLLEGTVDPIKECLKLLRKEKCLVAIHGSFTVADWKSIENTFLSEDTQSIIIVNSSFLLSRWGSCIPHKVIRLGTQQDTYEKEYRSVFYTERCRKALEWTEKFQLGRREWDEYHYELTRHKLVSVWGIPGVGKSSLVRSIYSKEMLSSAVPSTRRSRGYPPSLAVFPRRRMRSFIAFAWVDVPSPFSLTEFAWRLLLDFYSDDPQAKQTATISMIEGQVPIQECRDIIERQRCLVVINRLRSMQDWDLIQAAFELQHIAGTIVVITNEENVAMHCVQNIKEQVLNIRCPQSDAALNLLEKIAGEHNQLTSEQMEVSKSIVAKCGRLPGVIATIGEVYRSDIRELQVLCDNFMVKLETEPRFHGLKPILSWIQSYIDASSDSTKPCIFYLSIFSAEKKIRRQRLLWRWIAEGYCRDASDGTTSVENGEKFISELVNLSIIQQSKINKVFCEINGFIHEYITSRQMEDNLVFALEGRCSLNSTRAGQHLTVRSSWDRRDEIVYGSIDFSRLRSLTVSGKWESFFISRNINMKLLRVLDLEDATDVSNDDLEQIGKLLLRLKFLSLRGCREITCLPSRIGGLMLLQTLDLRHTSIVTLPIFITKLQKLRYIRAGTSTMEVWDWDTMEVCDWEEGDNVVAADGEDRASTPAAAAQVTSLTVTSSSSAAAATTTTQVTNLPVAAEAAAGGGAGTDSAAPVLPPEIAGSSVSGNTNRPRNPNLVPSFLSKLCRRGSGLDNNNDGGVKVPAGIKKLSVLHTLGVVNVNCTSCGESIFEELKNLSQLRKLGVSGINERNIKEFYEAISGHAHLKSLSVVLDRDDELDGLPSLDGIPKLPKTLKSLKLFGHVNKLLVWIDQLPNLEKLKVDLTIKEPEKLILIEPSYKTISHLRISPIQDGNLNFRGSWESTRVLEIQCSSVLHIMFSDYYIEEVSCNIIEVLKVDFSRRSGSSLQISGPSGLACLKEVWLKGYSNEQKQYMQQQIDQMVSPRQLKRPVLKLVQPVSS